MSSSPSHGSASIRRNPTLLTAWIVLGLAAVLELILASIPLAPRIAAGFRPVASSTDRQNGLPSPGGESSPTIAREDAAPSQSRQILPGNSSLPAADARFHPESSLPLPVELPSRQPPPDAASQGGAALQIVSDRLVSSGEGTRKLQVAIKSGGREAIQVSDVKVQVYFYDEENGVISPSKAQVTSNWLTLPVNWKKGTPELLEVNYLPDAADGSISFAGYVVAIYYRGDLQDYRANPPKLKRMFEPKYFIGNDEP